MANQTRSKRIALSLKPEIYSVISDLAELNNKPMSVIVVELLDQMLPVLQANRDALKSLNLGVDPSKAFLAMFANTFTELGEFGEELKGAIQKND